jgi:hypothetical protein
MIVEADGPNASVATPSLVEATPRPKRTARKKAE